MKPHDEITDSVRIAIGNLLLRADPVSKMVITAFNPDASRSSNISTFTAKFKVSVLETCAEFLGITLADEDDNKIYTKATLSPRVVSGIQALLPSTCAECSESYTVDLEPEEEPLYTCYLCFRGSHCCDPIKEKHKAISGQTLPSGFIWLCKLCVEDNNPVNPRKSKSRHNSVSKVEHVRSRMNSGTDQTPVIPKLPPQGLSLEEQEKLRKEFILQLEVDDDPDKDERVPRYQNVCKLYKQGKCPHGIRGNKLIQGVKCPKEHPKKCFKYMKFGSTGRGCVKSDSCDYYHPTLCKYSVRNRKCTNESCSFPHLRGTVRRNNSGQKAVHRSNSSQKPKNDKKAEVPSPQNHFLELKKLVETMNYKFQEELNMIKSSLSPQHQYSTMMMNQPVHLRPNIIPQAPHQPPWMFCTPPSSS